MDVIPTMKCYCRDIGEDVEVIKPSLGGCVQVRSLKTGKKHIVHWCYLEAIGLTDRK